ncbi:hypothetical protein GC173_15735 [bacterium]|nr:hypothetical protein [bacterium]
MVRFLASLIVVVLTVVGCGNTNRTPRYEVPKPLEIKTFKRHSKYPSVDYIFQFKQTAYSPVKKPLTKRLSVTQQDVLERHGQPDYIRKSFTATTNEKVTEWAYIDRLVLAQFVQGELVYEGPLTERDRYLISNGYPRRAWSQDYADGVRRDIWEYQPISLDSRSRLATFTDERLVSEQTY